MTTLYKVKSLIQSANDFSRRVFFTSFDGKSRTPLTGDDAEDKESTLAFINSAPNKHVTELLDVFTDIKLNHEQFAIVEDLYQEGVLIKCLSKSAYLSLGSEQEKPPLNNVTEHDASDPIFIPFRTNKGNARQRLYYLRVEAQIKKGILDDLLVSIVPQSKDKQYFKVIKTQFVTKNLLRIFIKSENKLPTNNAGYAYRFLLTHTLEKNKGHLGIHSLVIKLWGKLVPVMMKVIDVSKIIQLLKKYAYLVALKIFKCLPEGNKKNKKQPVGTIKKRYYTLRQLKSNDDPFTGEVDIYIHDDTAGSVWAKSLKTGDSIVAVNSYEETIKNMTIGQPLFICDETSMPSVAAALEQWNCTVVPIVISITNDREDFNYFNDVSLPEQLIGRLEIKYINGTNETDICAAVIDIIKQEDKLINCAWGAIGDQHYRPIKKYLRDTYGLKGKINRIRPYWI